MKLKLKIASICLGFKCWLIEPIFFEFRHEENKSSFIK